MTLQRYEKITKLAFEYKRELQIIVEYRNYNKKKEHEMCLLKE